MVAFVKPDIDISAEDEYSFKMACENNNLELAKWLLSVKPDIEDAFVIACSFGNLEMSQWLLSLNTDD